VLPFITNFEFAIEKQEAEMYKRIIFAECCSVVLAFLLHIVEVAGLNLTP
jgi:hypothetical protein